MWEIEPGPLCSNKMWFPILQLGGDLLHCRFYHLLRCQVLLAGGAQTLLLVGGRFGDRTWDLEWSLHLCIQSNNSYWSHALVTRIGAGVTMPDKNDRVGLHRVLTPPLLLGGFPFYQSHFTSLTLLSHLCSAVKPIGAISNEIWDTVGVPWEVRLVVVFSVSSPGGVSVTVSWAGLPFSSWLIHELCTLVDYALRWPWNPAFLRLVMHKKLVLLSQKLFFPPQKIK